MSSVTDDHEMHRDEVVRLLADRIESPRWAPPPDLCRDDMETVAMSLLTAALVWVGAARDETSPDAGTSADPFVHAAEAARGMINHGFMVAHPPPASESSIPNNGNHVYRLWQSDGRLLYVGVSKRLRDRLKSHERRWGDMWDHATWDSYPDERSMLEAEADAIIEELPALNRAGIR